MQYVALYKGDRQGARPIMNREERLLPSRLDFLNFCREKHLGPAEVGPPGVTMEGAMPKHAVAVVSQVAELGLFFAAAAALGAGLLGLR